MSEIIEILSEKVHDAWWKEKEKQGFHAPIDCVIVKSIPTVGEEETKREMFTRHCDECHTDMYPYSELPEHIKEYDRVTVRTVLKALSEGC